MKKHNKVDPIHSIMVNITCFCHSRCNLPGVSITQTADGSWKWTMDPSKKFECQRVKIAGYSTKIIASDNNFELFEGSLLFSTDKVISGNIDDGVDSFD